MGKTSLKDKYIGHGFQGDYLPTLGADFVSKEIGITRKAETTKIKLQIWDLAGQPSFEHVRALYYKHAVGAFLVFDVVQPDSLQNLKKWMEELSKHSGSPNISVIVLGNKIDLQEESDNFVDAKTARKFISEQLIGNSGQRNENITYYETSAKTGENVEKAFHELSLKILTNYSP